MIRGQRLSSRLDVRLDTVAARADSEHYFVMVRPIKVEPVSGYRLRIRYADGVEGIIDLSDQVGRGVFAPLRDEAFFRKVQIRDRGQISWSADLDICPDSAYLEITGKILARAKNA
jgi:hypothetical protein